jgi:MFS-type transporter involved in bile tolerance (Atg22 family)
MLQGLNPGHLCDPIACLSGASPLTGFRIHHNGATLQADAATEMKFTVGFLGSKMDPTAYASLFISFSVLFQAVAFLAIGAAGDYGENRKRFLIFFSVSGSITCILYSDPNP